MLRKYGNVSSGNDTKHGWANEGGKGMGHLAETANMGSDATALVDRQKKNIALNMVKETTLPMDVG